MDTGYARDAEKAFTRAIQLDPDCELAMYDLGVLRKKQRSYEDAEQLFRKVVARQPTDILAWYGLETSLYLRGNLAECENVLHNELKQKDIPNEEKLSVRAFLTRVQAERRLQSPQI